MGVGFTIKNKANVKGALSVGGGGYMTKVQAGVVSVTPGTIAAGTTTLREVALSGVGTADKVFAGAVPSNLPGGCILTGFRVSAAGSITAVFTNPSAAAGTVNSALSIPYLWIAGGAS